MSQVLYECDMLQSLYKLVGLLKAQPRANNHK